jgi:hypothetical protein
MARTDRLLANGVGDQKRRFDSLQDEKNEGPNEECNDYHTQHQHEQEAMFAEWEWELSYDQRRPLSE